MMPLEDGSDSPKGHDQRNEALAHAEIGVQAFIFLLAVLGNAAVLFVLKYRKLKTSKMSLFITHLSIADLMVAFFNILPQMAWDITLRFQGSNSLCKFIKFMQVAVIYSSTYILVMTAIDRYIAICKPMDSYIWTRQRAHLMIVFAWIMSFVLSTPQLAIFKIRPIEANSSVHDCWGTFQPEWTVKLYATFFSVTIYILPLMILTVLYGRICLVVWRNLHREQGNVASRHYAHQNGRVIYKFTGKGHISIIPDKKKIKCCSCSKAFNQDICETKMKTIKLTFVVIIAYIICWSPFMISQLWYAFDTNAPTNSK